MIHQPSPTPTLPSAALRLACRQLLLLGGSLTAGALLSGLPTGEVAAQAATDPAPTPTDNRVDNNH